MVNLKSDLINKITTDKMYQEVELVRLAQDPNMNYEQKIIDMKYQLERLSVLNSEMGLIEVYFKDAPVAATPAPGAPVQQNAPAGQVHPGQTHGE